MKYLARRAINKITRGRWAGLRSSISSLIKDDIQYYLNTDIGRKLYFSGDFEQAELNLCKKFIKNDSTIIDIGANIGVHSIYFSEIASNGKVLSIEPQVTIYPVLLQNISKYDNIIPLNVAVDTDLKISSFFIADDNAYSSLKDTKRKKILNVKQVVTLPFDLIIDLFDKVDFIKIDVEGYEKNVLSSMKKILLRDKPVLFVEIYQGINSNEDPMGTVEILIDMGYQAYIVNKANDLEKFTSHSDSNYNYFFIYE